MTEKRKRSTALVQASTDRTVPTEYVGTIEPNFYCRGWNAKRLKYCRQYAGFGTTHRGRGRCKMHGGIQENDARVIHGRYGTVHSTKMVELIEQHAADPDPLNVADDLTVLRAALQLLMEKPPEDGKLTDTIAFVDGVRGTVDAISKVIHRVEQLKTAGAVSLDQVRRFLGAVDRVQRVLLVLRGEVPRAQVHLLLRDRLRRVECREEQLAGLRPRILPAQA